MDKERGLLGAPPPAARPWGPALLALGLAGFWGVRHHQGRRQGEHAGTAASSGRLTLAEDDGGSLGSVRRAEGLELWYRVTLDPAPVGAELSLECDWTGPDGRLARRNRYRTKKIERSPWPTHARFKPGAQARPGRWTATLKLGKTALHSLSFELLP